MALCVLCECMCALRRSPVERSGLIELQRRSFAKFVSVCGNLFIRIRSHNSFCWRSYASMCLCLHISSGQQYIKIVCNFQDHRRDHVVTLTASPIWTRSNRNRSHYQPFNVKDHFFLCLLGGQLFIDVKFVVLVSAIYMAYLL